MSVSDECIDDDHDDDHRREPADPPPSQVNGRTRRHTRIAPPTMKPSRLPTPVVECGCGDCDDAVDPLADDGTTVYAADECDDAQPMTVKRASEAYLAYQKAAWDADDRTSVYERAQTTYGRLLEADREQQRQFDDDLTTVMVTRRLSPIDDSADGDEWVHPTTLSNRLHSSTSAVMDSVRYYLREFDYRYVAVTAMTDSCATPHEHLYLWIVDPHNEVTREHFRAAVEKHVETVAGAFEADHGRGAITVRHDPPLVDHVPDKATEIMDYTDDRTPVNTAGAQYLASQLPHLVLGDIYDGTTDVDDARVDGGAVAWAMTHKTVRSSRGITLT